MFNTRNTRMSVLLASYVTALSPLSFAQEAGAPAESKTPAGNGGDKPRTAFQAKRNIAAPVYDVENMSVEEMKKALATLQSQIATGSVTTRSFRFNDGAEKTFYVEGEEIRDPNTGKLTGKKAKGGEVKSPRDSGTISVYGFQRNPISLYPRQWLELAAFMQDIVGFIFLNHEHINEYLRTRKGGEQGQNDVNMELVAQLQSTYEAEVDLTTLRGLIRGYDPDLLDVLLASQAAPEEEDEVEQGIVHTVETQEPTGEIAATAELGGEG